MPETPVKPRRNRYSLARRTWLACAIALTLFAGGAISLYTYYYFDEAVGSRVLCLMYHRITTPEEFAKCRGDERYYAIPANRFEQHLKYLAKQGYHTLSTAQCMDFLAGHDVPEKSVLITIDDGYESALTMAQPLLKKYGLRATLFATVDPLARIFHEGHPQQPRLTDAELRRLDPTVIDIEAHGLTHTPLTHLTDNQLMTELTNARQRLEAILHRPVLCMSVPGNDYDERVLQFSKKAGYKTVFTSDPGSLDVGDDPIGLPRVNVAGYFETSGLASILDPNAMARRRFIRALTWGPRATLGTVIGTPISRATSALFAFQPPSAIYLWTAIAAVVCIWSVPLVRPRRRIEEAIQPTGDSAS